MPSWVSFCSFQGNCIRVQDGPQQESWHWGDGSLADARPNLSCSLQWHPCDMEIFIQVMQPECASGQTPFSKHRLLARKGNSLQTAWMLCPLNLENLTNSVNYLLRVWQLIPQTHWRPAPHYRCGGWVGRRGACKADLKFPSTAESSCLGTCGLCPGWSRVCSWPCFSLGLEWLVSGGLTPTYVCHWICQLTPRILYHW